MDKTESNWTFYILLLTVLLKISRAYSIHGIGNRSIVMITDCDHYHYQKIPRTYVLIGATCHCFVLPHNMPFIAQWIDKKSGRVITEAIQKAPISVKAAYISNEPICKIKNMELANIDTKNEKTQPSPTKQLPFVSYGPTKMRLDVTPPRFSDICKAVLTLRCIFPRNTYAPPPLVSCTFEVPTTNTISSPWESIYVPHFDYILKYRATMYEPGEVLVKCEAKNRFDKRVRRTAMLMFEVKEQGSPACLKIQYSNITIEYQIVSNAIDIDLNDNETTIDRIDKTTTTEIYEEDKTTDYESNIWLLIGMGIGIFLASCFCFLAGLGVGFKLSKKIKSKDKPMLPSPDIMIQPHFEVYEEIAEREEPLREAYVDHGNVPPIPCQHIKKSTRNYPEGLCHQNDVQESEDGYLIPSTFIGNQPSPIGTTQQERPSNKATNDVSNGAQQDCISKEQHSKQLQKKQKQTKNPLKGWFKSSPIPDDKRDMKQNKEPQQEQHHVQTDYDGLYEEPDKNDYYLKVKQSPGTNHHQKEQDTDEAMYETMYEMVPPKKKIL